MAGKTPGCQRLLRPSLVKRLWRDGLKSGAKGRLKGWHDSSPPGGRGGGLELLERLEDPRKSYKILGNLKKVLGKHMNLWRFAFDSLAKSERL